MLFANNAFGYLHHKGGLDEERGDFYFTGLDIYRWSGNKRKEFKSKWNTIYKYNLEKKVMSIFYDGRCTLWDVQISRNNDHVSVLCTLEDKPRTLIVFDRDGQRVLVLPEDVQEYVWHPAGNKIIYMTGKKIYRGDDFDIKSNGIWLYDLKERAKEKIAEKVWHLRTGSLDKHLYYWNGEKTIRYNFYSGKSEETDLKEKVEYSPD